MDDLVHSGAVQLFSQTLDRSWPRRPHESRWSTRPRLAAGPIVTMSGTIANAPVGCAGGTRDFEPRDAVLHDVDHGGKVDAGGQQPSRCSSPHRLPSGSTRRTGCSPPEVAAVATAMASRASCVTASKPSRVAIRLNRRVTTASCTAGSAASSCQEPCVVATSFSIDRRRQSGWSPSSCARPQAFTEPVEVTFLGHQEERELPGVSSRRMVASQPVPRHVSSCLCLMGQLLVVARPRDHGMAEDLDQVVPVGRLEQLLSVRGHPRGCRTATH